jgi:DNA mismatch repair ATPase MutS
VLFDAEALGHPLLPAGAVRNDARLARGEVVVLTGSNMAGKSTFLRSVGVAAAMAWAGAPIVAGRLVIAPVRPFTSMRVGDALQEGVSTFYAEVRRLRLLLDAVEAGAEGGAPPALVLLDEVYRGTNNRERLAGARALVRTLAGARAASLVATHDLALTRLADDAGAVRNAHFRERVDAGALVFDYTLRPGPCPTTNALAIMAAAGLPVEPPDDAG